MALTLLVMLIARLTGGKLPIVIVLPFFEWFSVSVYVFGAVGMWAAYHAWREPAHRKAYMTDVILALVWIPYWFSNLR
jgi:hypothetical protein